MRKLVCLISILLAAEQSLSAIDLNGDGMSDVWQKIYNVPSSDANLDYNGVGLTNIQKSLLGLDPRATNTRFVLQQVPNFPNGTISLTMNPAYAKQYQMDTSSDLTNWSPVGSVIDGKNGSTATVVVTLSQGATKAFFRCRYVGDDQLAGDQFTTWEKHQLGLNENAVDTDGDGIPDWWEWERGLNPLTSNANNVDPAGNGQTYLQEYQSGASPIGFTDYYNGSTPTLTKVYGDSQTAPPNMFLNGALVVQVTNSAGQLLANAPVVFSANAGNLAAANNSSAALSNQVLVHTSADGWASIYFQTPAGGNSSSSITATAGPVNAPTSAGFTGTASTSPTPTPSPTATPTPQSATNITVVMNAQPFGSASFSLHIGGQTVTNTTRILTFQRGQSYTVSVVRNSGSGDRYSATIYDGMYQYMILDDPNGLLGSNQSYAQTNGKTGTLTFPQVRLITPSGDPVGAPNDSYGSDGQNQFTFGSATNGWLTIPMKALVTPSGFANRIKSDVKLSVGAVGSISSTSESIQASGDFLVEKVMFQGLPSDNSGFGSKGASVSLREAGEPGDSPDASNDGSQCEVFFPKTAKNHPNGQANSPNWFYYWGLTSANKVSGQPRVFYVNEFTSAYYFADDSIHITDDAAGTSAIGAWGSPKGIDLFAWTMAHEGKHRSQQQGFWPPSGYASYNSTLDSDADLIPNNTEPTYMSGRPYDPNNAFTYFDTIGYGGPPSTTRKIADIEDIDMRSQTQQNGDYPVDPLWTNGSANSQDWANPGRNAKSQF